MTKPCDSRTKNNHKFQKKYERKEREKNLKEFGITSMFIKSGHLPATYLVIWNWLSNKSSLFFQQM